MLGVLFAAYVIPRPKGAKPAAETGGAQTEFVAEVVRVTQVNAHPNADRLELVRFELRGSGETAYEVVSQTGTYKPGDLAAYLSVDCIVPLDRPEFAFLATRDDGRGKTHYHIRAARLRGVFSQGLLVPPPADYLFGDRVVEALGVSYFTPPEEKPTPGERPVRRSKGQPMPIYGVDSLKKAPRLFAEGEPVLVTEKIHGTNFRFGWVPRRILGFRFGWRFVVGSHRTIKEPGRGNHFYGEDVWSKAAESMGLAAKTAPFKGHTFFGELYGYTHSGQKIQDLTYGRVPAQGAGLAIFDVLGPTGWLTPTQRRAILFRTKLAPVPALMIADYHPGLLKLAEGTSTLAPHVREGVVIESLTAPRKKAKYVGQGYLLRAGA